MLSTQEIDKFRDGLSKSIFSHETLSESVGTLQSKLDHSVETRDKLQDDVYLDVGANEAISILIEKVNERALGELVGLVNRAIGYIFDDRNFTFFHLIGQSRGRILNFYLKEIEPNGSEIVADIRDAMGDGIRTVVGLMILIFYIKLTKSKRIIVLDEAVTSINEIYLENFFAFIRGVAKEGQFTFLIISHDPRFEQYVDHVYIMRKGRLHDGAIKERDQSSN